MIRFGLPLDVTFAGRLFSRKRGMALVAIWVMAVGISMVALSFELLMTVTSGAAPSPETLAKIGFRSPIGLSGVGPLQAHLVGELAEQSTSFSQVAGVEDFTANLDLGGGGSVSQVEIARVTENFFKLSGVPPLRGRWLQSSDHVRSAQDVVVMSYHLWVRLFGGDERIVGRSVVLDARSHLVVGVMPSKFVFPMVDAWVPADDSMSTINPKRTATAFARLLPSHSWETAKAEVAVIAGRLRAVHPETFRDRTLALITLKEEAQSRVGMTNLLLLGPSFLLLVVSCLVVGNLLLGNAIDREREMGVRLALGATRLRLVRQLLTEHLLIALPSGAIALFLLWIEVMLIRAASPLQIRWATEALSVRPATLVFAIVVTCLTPLIFGIIPAAYSFRRSLVASLQQDFRTSRPGLGHYTVRDLLVIMQVAATIIIIATLAIVRNVMWTALKYETGFETADLYAVRAAVDPNERPSAIDSTLFLNRTDIVGRIAQVPGVRKVSLVDSLPAAGERAVSVSASHAPSTEARARYVAVDETFFETLGVRVTSGRALGPDDIENRRAVAVVSASCADLLWGGLGGVGQTLLVAGDKGQRAAFAVVGVVGDMNYSALHPESRRAVYVPLPFAGADRAELHFLVRTSRETAGVATQIHLAMGDEAPGWAAERPRPYRDAIERRRTIDGVSFFLTVFGTVGGITLILAIVGIAAVTVEAVKANRRTMGIRAALGATPFSLVALIMRQGSVKVVAGLLLGLPGPVVYNYVNPPVDFAQSPAAMFASPTSWLIVLASICLIECGCYMSARGASRSSPAILMRCE